MKIASLAAAALAAASLLPAHAIVTRADRDDEEYVELATRYPTALALGPQGGVGVLVAPRWILTAAQAAATLRAKTRLAVAGSAHEIQEMFLHPGWKAGSGPEIIHGEI